ncbi:MipA/OmpV family protein [Rhizobium sp.]|uniref:MipA/OmpV family protein n=1 Tax=Rhizobium sp. TaxID=391 RepID=UPI002AA7034E
MAMGSSCAYAADVQGQSAPVTEPDRWIVTLGASMEYGPNHPGSRHNGISGMPSFDVRRYGEAPENSAPDDSLDYGLFDFHGFQMGPVVNMRDNRSSSESNGLNGVHRIQTSLDAGVFLQYWAIPNQLRFRSEIREALSNGSGLVVDVSSDWFQPVGDRWILSVGPRVSFGSAAYMHEYFSISPAESAANGTLSAYDAGAGLKSVGAMLSASYALTPDWSVTLYDRFDRLVGDAASSPVTAKIGTPNQNIVGISLSKEFTVSF